jgi:hypothetical protein
MELPTSILNIKMLSGKVGGRRLIKKWNEMLSDTLHFIAYGLKIYI